MASSVQPSNQTQTINPYGGRVFDFNTVDSRVYLSRAINTLFKVVGSNCILEGFLISSSTYNSSTDVVTITVGSGKAILDDTLIDFPSSTTLDLDVSGLDESGSLIVSLGFSYVPTVYANKSAMKLLYVSQDGSQVLPNSWFTNYDRVVVGRLSFNKTSKTVQNNTSISSTSIQNITVLGTTFEIYPLDNLTKRVKGLLLIPEYTI